MSEWSTTFVFIAILLVVVALGSSWVAVRVMRGRRPTPHVRAEEEREHRDQDGRQD